MAWVDIYFGLRSIPELREQPSGSARRTAWRSAFQQLKSGTRTWFAVVDLLIGLLLVVGMTSAEHFSFPIINKIVATAAYAVLGLAWWQVKVRSVVRILRKQSGNLCVECGYSLIENVSGICPECGTPIKSATAGG